MLQPLITSTILDVLHRAVPALMWFLCGYLYAMHYDRVQLKCAYFMKHRRMEALFIVSWFSTMVVSFAVACTHNRWMPCVIDFVQVMTCFALEASLGLPRMRDQQRVITVRYMQHKYGLDFGLLLALVDRHKLACFPITYFERRAGLTEQQCASYEATVDTCNTMKPLVEREFCLPLSASDIEQPDCAQALARYHRDNESLVMCNKLTRITKDFYSSAPKAK